MLNKEMKTILIPRFSDKKYGGNAYEQEVVNSLKDSFKIDLVRLYDRSSLLKTAFKLIGGAFKLKFNRSALLLLDQSTIFFYSWLSNNAILIVHHVDWSQSHWLSAFLQKFSYSIMLFRKKKWKKIIVVSEYWKNFLERKGFKNIEIIYNAIDPGISDLPLLSKRDFFEKYGLPSKKLIYLGNAQRGKGWREVYEKLKTQDYAFIISGQQDRDIHSLPSKVWYLNLPYLDYLAMLRHIDVAILFSIFQEGWNRTAHECILMGTPVIGSNSGGMAELLKKSGQIICYDINDVEKCLEFALNNRREKVFNGLDYLRQLDPSYFKIAWSRAAKSF